MGCALLSGARKIWINKKKKILFAIKLIQADYSRGTGLLKHFHPIIDNKINEKEEATKVFDVNNLFILF